MAKRKKVEYIDKNKKLVEEVVSAVDTYEPPTWGTIDDAVMHMAKLKDEKFRELVEGYIKLAYDNGEPANLLEDLLKEI